MASAEHWMQRAIELAKDAERCGEVPIGAVVVRDGVLLGEGFNQTITLGDPTAHAEMVAIRNAASNAGNHRLVDAEIFVTIEPCTMCAGAMVHARIKTLYYGAAEPRAGAVGSSIDVLSNPALNHKIEVIGGVCAQEAGALMTNFFKSRRN